jgi:hypothetical protein
MKTETPKIDFVNIATFDEASSAEALKSFLIGEGLDARVQDETHLQRFWFMALAKAGFHVMIPKQQLGIAQQIVKEPQSAPYVRKAIHCPSCDSLRVQYPDLSRKSVLPTLFFDLFVLLHITKHKYYCEDYHFSWPKSGSSAALLPPTPLVPKHRNS